MEVKILYCRNCGFKLNDSDKFCEKCGTKTRAEEVPTSNATENKIEPYTQSVRIPPNSTKVVKKKKSRVGLYILIIVAFFVLAMLRQGFSLPDAVGLDDVLKKSVELVVNEDDFTIRAAKDIVVQNAVSPKSIEWESVAIVEKDQYGRILVDVVLDSQNQFGAMVRSYALVVIESIDNTGEYNYSPLFGLSNYEEPGLRNFGIEVAKTTNNWNKPFETSSLEKNVNDLKEIEKSIWELIELEKVILYRDDGTAVITISSIGDDKFELLMFSQTNQNSKLLDRTDYIRKEDKSHFVPAFDNVSHGVTFRIEQDHIDLYSDEITYQEYEGNSFIGKYYISPFGVSDAQKQNLIMAADDQKRKGENQERTENTAKAEIEFTLVVPSNWEKDNKYDAYYINVKNYPDFRIDKDYVENGISLESYIDDLTDHYKSTPWIRLYNVKSQKIGQNEFFKLEYTYEAEEKLYYELSYVMKTGQVVGTFNYSSLDRIDDETMNQIEDVLSTLSIRQY